MRGVTTWLMNFFALLEFQLTRLMRGVTNLYYNILLLCTISTHTPHARRDVSVDEESKKYIVFQLTRLMRGVTFLRMV